MKYSRIRTSPKSEGIKEPNKNSKLEREAHSDGRIP